MKFTPINSLSMKLDSLYMKFTPINFLQESYPYCGA